MATHLYEPKSDGPTDLTSNFIATLYALSTSIVSYFPPKNQREKKNYYKKYHFNDSIIIILTIMWKLFKLCHFNVLYGLYKWLVDVDCTIITSSSDYYTELSSYMNTNNPKYSIDTFFIFLFTSLVFGTRIKWWSKCVML